MSNLDQQLWHEHQAEVWKEEQKYRSAIMAIIIEHNNSQGSPLYMKLWERKNIMTISMQEWRVLAPGIFQKAESVIFERVLAKLLAEAYWIIAVEIQNWTYRNREDVPEDHKALLIRCYPTDEFLGWIKEQKWWMHVDLPTGTNLVSISDEVVQKYLEAAKENAQRMWAKEDSNVNLSWIIVDA
jgi:hypothetical protein